MQNESLKEEKIYTKRIGTFTFGIMLILLGVIAIVQIFIPFTLLRYILMLWPILFISLGAEALYYNYKKNITIKYSFSSTLLLLFLILVGCGLAFTNEIINNFLLNEDIQNTVSQSIISKNYHYSFNNICEIINNSGKPVNIQYIQKNDLSDIYINANYSSTKNILINEFISSNFHNTISVINKNDKTTIIINELPEYISNLDIYIYVDDINNITQTNCNII